LLSLWGENIKKKGIEQKDSIIRQVDPSYKSCNKNCFGLKVLVAYQVLEDTFQRLTDGVSIYETQTRSVKISVRESERGERQ
jgi:hypothetical protein